VVAHDLRNPLSALRMTAAILAPPKEMPTERRVQLTGAHASAASAA
jgi:signal transduction histidine kinase